MKINRKEYESAPPVHYSISSTLKIHSKQPNIQIDDIWAENAHRALRLLSCVSPIKKIKISKVFGSCQYGANTFSNHNVLPDCSGSRFEDISISGMYCNNLQSTWAEQIRLCAPAIFSLRNLSDGNITLLHNEVEIEVLNIYDISLQGEDGRTVQLLVNTGSIGSFCKMFIHDRVGKLNK